MHHETLNETPSNKSPKKRIWFVLLLLISIIALLVTTYFVFFHPSYQKLLSSLNEKNEELKKTQEELDEKEDSLEKSKETCNELEINLDSMAKELNISKEEIKKMQEATTQNFKSYLQTTSYLTVLEECGTYEQKYSKKTFSTITGHIIRGYETVETYSIISDYKACFSFYLRDIDCSISDNGEVQLKFSPSDLQITSIDTKLTSIKGNSCLNYKLNKLIEIELDKVPQDSIVLLQNYMYKAIESKCYNDHQTVEKATENLIENLKHLAEMFQLKSISINNQTYQLSNN